jgi:hypothetical protein
VSSGPGAARTILLSHIISVKSSKQPLMVLTFLKVYMELGFYFLFLQEQKKDIIIIIAVTQSSARPRGRSREMIAAHGGGPGQGFPCSLLTLCRHLVRQRGSCQGTDLKTHFQKQPRRYDMYYTLCLRCAS